MNPATTLMTSHTSKGAIGIIGFWGNLCNMAGSMIIPILVSGPKLQRRWKEVYIFLTGLCSLMVAAFAYLIYMQYPAPFVANANCSNGTHVYVAHLVQ
jgi:sugar phosphate permease